MNARRVCAAVSEQAIGGTGCKMSSQDGALLAGSQASKLWRSVEPVRCAPHKTNTEDIGCVILHSSGWLAT